MNGDPREITALLIPADPGEPCTVLALPLTSVALSDAIGGGLLDDAYYGSVTSNTDGSAEPVATQDAGSGGYCLYLDEDRVPRQLPLNDRAAALGIRLGWPPRHDVVLRGDVLVTGATPTGRDTSVGAGVLTAAVRAGLIGSHAARAVAGAGGQVLHDAGQGR